MSPQTPARSAWNMWPLREGWGGLISAMSRSSPPFPTFNYLRRTAIHVSAESVEAVQRFLDYE